MEEEAEKLKEMQTEVDKQMNMSSPTATRKFRLQCTFIFKVLSRSIYLAQVLGSQSFNCKIIAAAVPFPTPEEKQEADGKSIYVGNVSGACKLFFKTFIH